jgi:hypothetical protein
MTRKQLLVFNVNEINYDGHPNLVQYKGVYVIVNKCCGAFAQTKNSGARETAIDR